MATISVGGLATGLDTNNIIDQLVRIERRRGVDFLQAQWQYAQSRQTAVQTFNSKLVALLGAVDNLRGTGDVLARRATSSDATVLGAVAGKGAAAGSTTLTVLGLARQSIATSANGKGSADSTIAAAAGTFAFRLGGGAVQTIAIDATTTLQGLASAINGLSAGVGATVVNIGTEAAPSHRLRLASDATGASNEIAIVTDDTDLAVSVTQTASDATLTVSGFADPVTRESNTIGDLIPGLTLSLSGTGSTTVTVATDVESVTAKVRAAVTAFNDIIDFVRAQSAVSQDTASDQRQVTLGPLAFDGTVRSVLDALRQAISETVPGLPGKYTLPAQVGITTSRDGTLAFDAAKLETALADDERAVEGLFAGSETVGGVADRLHDLLTSVTQAGGLVAIRSGTLGGQIATLEERIAAGERNLVQFEKNLRATFASLEVLVSNLQSQGTFLLNALRRESD